MFSACAAGSVGSSSDSGSRSDRASTSSGSSSDELKPGWFSPEIYGPSVERLRSETTSELRTSDVGLDAWTFSLRAGRARVSRPHLEADHGTQTYGLQSAEPPQSVDRNGSSSRTSTELRGPWLSTNWTASGIGRLVVSTALRIWALPIEDRARFYWPTPTAKANHWAPSMRKWPAYARIQDEAPPTPALFELMMGLPEGWIVSALPVRASFRRWLRAHGRS